jgi:N-acetylglutamate synthase-like GNAT family acetyltransferase
MRSVVARFAGNSDGPAIKALLAATEQDLPVAFDDIEGFWIVAEWKGKVIGCIQLCYGKPVGSLEMLAIGAVPGMIKGHAVRELILSGMAMLHGRGIRFVRGFVPFRLKSYKRALRKRGGEAMDQGNLILRRIG